MRFVWAVLAFVLAALLIGAGIAQRTVFLGPKTQQVSVTIDDPAPYALIDGAVLRTKPGAQTLVVRGEGEIFAAYGRTADLQAWLSDTTYTDITTDDAGEFLVRTIEPEPAAEEPSDAEETPADQEAPAEETTPEDEEAATPGRNPAGSDLWLDQFTAEDLLTADMQLPDGMSVLIARDGTENAPDSISVSWPLDNATPWAGPLMVAGGVVMAVGILLYILAIRHQRRGRGPRRKGLGPLPPTEPIDMELLAAARRDALPAGAEASDDEMEIEAEIVPEEPGEDTAQAEPSASDSGASDSGTMRRTRLRLALPALGLSLAMLTGCTPESWPQSGPTPTPSPTETVITPENQQAPAVTEAQAQRILQEIADTVAQADETLDADLLATRMSGAPLTERKTDYALRGALPERSAPAAIPTDKVSILLPQAFDGWPRTVLMLTEAEPEPTPTATPAEGEEAAAEEPTTPAPVILTMVQESPWEPYKLTYMAEMQAAAELPGVAPAWLGTQLIPPASPFLSLAPEKLPAAFVDLVDKGAESEFASTFDETTQKLAESIRASRQTIVQGLADSGAASTSSTAFAAKTTDFAPISLGTLDSGAIVSIAVIDTEKVTPTTSDAVIRLGENAEAKALTGVTESAKGFETQYSMQLFFSVPSQGSTEPVRLLAAHQTLLSVAVIQ